METKQTPVERAKEKAVEFLKNLRSDIDIAYYVDVDELDLHDPDGIYDAIRDQLEDSGAFDEEIIYYSMAMEFLREHDPSLQESLQIADDMGYSPKNLNSEILASLLASQVNRDEFSELEDEITLFFTDLRDELEEEEEEEEGQETNE